ncbi:tannase-domain-containing protein [Aspergillus heteromorphus CBS 117.55]|uniref:Carboxylic ester hydrolase n=1 Tax=Aspergillus heteromorphus CBS 117.55 TaxID=1448321 RepID=A0A317WIQ2_9EURO|nr:tannase-domain-containing protein [Aspergillus heteromorphus CBS 117.55]PWY85047.1 tannase-domain-containing protein [Aspergillus heteromorphus CBS 117.55]
MGLTLGLASLAFLLPFVSAQAHCNAGTPCPTNNATVYNATNAPNCTVRDIQVFVNGLSGLGGANLSVPYAFYLDSNETRDAFTDYVGASTFTNDIPNVCAFRVNGVNAEGANWGLGALVPESFNGSIMMAAPDVGLSWGVASAGLYYKFVTFASNSGHDEPDYVSGWETANGLIDWSHRALHMSTLTAKAIVNGWFGIEPKHSYITGCAEGGRQVMKSIQTYPEDYDGAMAGAPTWWATHQAFYSYKQSIIGDAAANIPTSMYEVIGAEVLLQCDAQDGLLDRIISDPVGCFFNPATLACSSNRTTDCLTPPQLDTLHKIYNDWTTFNQDLIYPGEWFGTEFTWNTTFSDSARGAWYIENVLGFKNFTSQDLTSELIAKADALDPANVNADDFDLEPFFSRGGKFIHWHGMSDSVVSPASSVYYHDHAEYAALQKNISIDDHYQLYLIPGLEHCSGTPSCMDALWYLAGPYQAGAWFNFTPANVVDDLVHDSFFALIDWVEVDYAPGYMVTTSFDDAEEPTTLLNNRKICAYPQLANWTRTGVSNHEDYWDCVYPYHHLGAGYGPSLISN